MGNGYDFKLSQWLNTPIYDMFFYSYAQADLMRMLEKCKIADNGSAIIANGIKLIIDTEKPECTETVLEALLNGQIHAEPEQQKSDASELEYGRGSKDSMCRNRIA